MRRGGTAEVEATQEAVQVRSKPVVLVEDQLDAPLEQPGHLGRRTRHRPFLRRQAHVHGGTGHALQLQRPQETRSF